MSDNPVGQYIFLEGYCGRVEAVDGSTTFMRIDKHSQAEKVDQAHEHFQTRHQEGKPFPGVGLWGNGVHVRIAALRWDAERRVLRLKIERVDPPAT